MCDNNSIICPYCGNIINTNGGIYSLVNNDRKCFDCNKDAIGNNSFNRGINKLYNASWSTSESGNPYKNIHISSAQSQSGTNKYNFYDTASSCIEPIAHEKYLTISFGQCDNGTNEHKLYDIASSCIKPIVHEGDSNMSILSTQIYDDHIIFVSDSRSTKFNQKTQKYEYNDNYQKMLYVKRYNMLIGSTGLNKFGGGSLEDCVSYLLRTCNNISIYDFIGNLNKIILKFTMLSGFGTIVHYGIIEKNSLIGNHQEFYYPKILIATIKDDININCIMQDQIINNAGETWAVELLKKNKFLCSNLSERIEKMKNIVDKLIEISETAEDVHCIGGKVLWADITLKGIVDGNIKIIN